MPNLSFKISGNQLFTPAILISIFALTYIISIQEFKDSYNTYSIILATAISFFLLKTFIISFATIEKTLINKKWFFLGFNLIAAFAQTWVCWLALRELTINSYPVYTVGGLLIASLGFYLQAFINKVPGLLKMCITGFLVYTIVFVLLLTTAFDAFVGNNLLLLVFQQTTGYMSLGIETILLFQVARQFINKN